MGLRAKMQRRAKIGEQQLSVESDQQIARFDILMNESSRMHIMKCIGCLFHVRNELFCKGQTLATIRLTEEVMDRLWCILHDKVGLLVLQLPKVIDGQDIWVMHTRN